MGSILSTQGKKNSPSPRNTTHPIESTVQGLLVAFDRQHVVATLIADPLGGVHLGVHRIGGDHRPVEVQGFEKLPERGDLWLDLSATRAWVRTAPVAWSRAARR